MKSNRERLWERVFTQIKEENVNDWAYQRVLGCIHSKLMEILTNHKAWIWWILNFSKWKKRAYVINENNWKNWERIDIWVLWQHIFNVRLYKWQDWVYRLTKVYDDILLWLRAVPEIIMDLITNESESINQDYQPYLLDEVQHTLTPITLEENNRPNTQNDLKQVFDSIEQLFKERGIRDTDVIILESGSESKICIWAGGNNTFNIWVKWDKSSHISISSYKGYYTVRWIQTNGLLSIESIPNTVRLFCENWLLEYHFKLIRATDRNMAIPVWIDEATWLDIF